MLCIATPAHVVRNGKFLAAASLVLYCAYLARGYFAFLPWYFAGIFWGFCAFFWFLYLKRLGETLGPEKLTLDTRRLFANFLTAYLLLALACGASHIPCSCASVISLVILLACGLAFLVVALNHIVVLWRLGTQLRR